MVQELFGIEMDSDMNIKVLDYKYINTFKE